MAAVEVAQAVTDVESQVASVVAVGLAVLLVLVAVKAFRWVRAALSGGDYFDSSWDDADRDYTQADYERDTRA